MMETHETPTGAGPPPASSRLIRPHDGNIVAGVAVGIARHLDLPNWVVRLAFVVTALAGGLGILLYATAWLLIPREGEARSTGSRWLTDVERRRSWASVILVSIAALIVVGSTGIIDGDLAFAAILGVIGVLLYRGQIGTSAPGGESLSANPPAFAGEEFGGDPMGTENERTFSSAPSEGPGRSERRRPRSTLGRWTIAVTIIALGVMGLADSVSNSIDLSLRHYFGATFVGLGAGLIVGAWVGRARGLVFLGVLLVPGLLASPLANIDLTEVNVRLAPTSLAELPQPLTYEVGRVILDLRRLELGGSDATIEADLGVGELVVITPHLSAVDAAASARVGQAVVFDSEWSGVGGSTITGSRSGDDGTLTIRADVGVGRVEISESGQSETRVDVAITDPASLGDSYRADFGSMRFDLSDLTLTSPRTVDIDMGIGSVEVILPEDSSSIVFGSVDVGRMVTPVGERSEADTNDTYQSGPDPLLTLDISVGAGEITIEEARQ